MPEQSSSLASNGEVVDITLVSLNRALGYIRWPICPPALELSDTMPVFICYGKAENVS